MDDLNSDGYIDYPEFIRAQQKASQTNNNQVWEQIENWDYLRKLRLTYNINVQFIEISMLYQRLIW